MAEQAKLFFWANRGLFSNNYLDYHLRDTSLWSEHLDSATTTFNEIKKVYENIKGLNIGAGQEAELEDKFIRPVLKALGFAYNVQPPSRRGFKKKRPDYALFNDEHTLKEAKKRSEKGFYTYASTILEAKYWGRRLNDSDKSDILDSRDPTAQTVKYLEDVHYNTDGKINWAVLTNGKIWRLFYYRATSRSGTFYEVDLEEIIKKDNPEDFLYFYLFFSRDAFIPDPVSNKTLLDLHLSGSEEYARKVSENLKDLIFEEVFEGLAEGFIHYRNNELSINQETDESRKEVFKGCLTLLYRLLFILHAESRNLLPVEEPAYQSVSLRKLKEDIYKDIQRLGSGKMSKRSYTYWARLESLFNIISEGEPSLNVPIYNGGLFEQQQNSFLKNHKMSDPYISEAIQKLTIDKEDKYPSGVIPFIDYSSLDVRHLGDIYEGLLEFQLKQAKEKITEVKEKGRFVWKNASQITKGTKTYKEKNKGELYIENSRHERKATGSYYTPHYIVEYIVNSTVGPVLEERLDKARKIINELNQLYNKQRKQLKKPKDWNHWEHPKEAQGKHITDIQGKEKELYETLFNVQVLDPAMGSGHFLVHTVDFISERIVTFLADYPDNAVIRAIHDMKNEILSDLKRQGVGIDEDKLTEVNLIKRVVMKRCVYGVDLNDMAVELAKLSLWLDSFTLGAPLSFLDHHLKIGNSLIGTDLEELDTFIYGKIGEKAGELFGLNLEPLKRAIRDMLFISELPDATISQVNRSSELYDDANKGLEGYRILLDMLIAEHFGVPEAKDMLKMEALKIDLNRLHESIQALPEKERAAIEKTINVSKETKLFHWEIEFPEVFYERTGDSEQKVEKKANPGFDCVIGNPPYGALESISYFRTKFDTISKSNDIYAAFMENSISLLKKYGCHSFIVPTSWQTGYMYSELRTKFLHNVSFEFLVNLPFDVFKDAYIDTCIFVLKNYKDESHISYVYEYPKNLKIYAIDTLHYERISQHSWLELDNNKIILNPPTISLLKKLGDNRFVSLGEITKSARGVLAKPKHIFQTKAKSLNPFFDGELLRYEISQPDKYIDYSSDLPESPSSFSYFTGPRLLIRRLISRQDRIMAISATDTFVNKKDLYIFKPLGEHSVNYFLALINSKLLSYVYYHSDIIAQKDDFRQTTLEGLRNLPIPCTCLSKKPNNLNQMLDTFFEAYMANEYLKAIKLVEKEITDTVNKYVHDVLSYLASTMMQLKENENMEVAGFLIWLEREIGTKLNNLKNKTKIEEYHEHSANEILDILKHNKKNISVNPSGRKFQELFENEFNRSVTKITPMKKSFQETDKLIDEIVFRLYGLTEQEKRIVMEGF